MRQFHILLLVLFSLSSASAQDPIIFTVAGGGPRNVPALEAALGGPQGVLIDSSGNIFVAASGLHRVLKIDGSGNLTIVAGNGFGGFAGDGGPATAASLFSPIDVALDAAGNLFIADRDNQRVRKVDPGGTITTVAGDGFFGFAGDGGPATAANLANPSGVAVDSNGNLYVSDRDNHRIRMVDPAGTITTVAGDGWAGFSGDGGPATDASLNQPMGVALDTDDNLYIADQLNQRIRLVDLGGTITTVAGNGSFGFSGDGGPALAASLANPIDVAVDAIGNLHVADLTNERVRIVDLAGTITTIGGNGITGFSGDGGPATAASLASPSGVFVDTAGTLYIADQANQRIRNVDQAGTIMTVGGNGFFGFSGEGIAASAASLLQPSGLAIDSDDNLYIADEVNHRVRRIDPAGIITTVAGSAFAGFSGDGGPATAARLFSPGGVVTDSAGNLYIADRGNQRVRKVDPAGTITTVAGNGSFGFSGDAGPATAASLANPIDLALDATGNLYIADQANHRVRRVDPTGTITTVAGNGSLGFSGDGGPATAASLTFPGGVAAADDDNLYIADRGNHRIRKVDSFGSITTVAGDGVIGFSGDGGPAVAANLNGPFRVAVDGAGNLFIADVLNQRVRVVDPTGTITTVAGSGVAGFSGDGGPATAASLAFPHGLAIDADGNLSIADRLNHRIRLVSLATNADTDGDGILDADDPCPAVAQGPSQLDFTGSLLVATDAGGLATVQLQAVLTDGSAAPIAGQEVVFSMTGALGTFTPECPGTTDASGVASCTLEQVPPDLYTVSIDFEEVPGCFDASAEDVFLTVFNPNQPRATGGGFIYPDAESTLPSTQDKAHFAFSIAIEKNKAAAGNLQFKYAAAGIVLESQAMSWYTLSNNKAMFQGVGSINGTGTFTFRVQATDGDKTGQPDHFDIVIWAGTNTESDPFHRAKNQVAGGNIVIQKK